MLSQAVETYLSVRRATGFKLTGLARYLRDFACFASARGDEFVVTQTAIDWARATHSPAQRKLRLQMIARLARFSQAEDPRHEVPPAGFFQRRHRRPHPLHLQPAGAPGPIGAGRSAQSIGILATPYL